VAQPQDAQKAADVARGVKGVASVKNDIRVK
jgi:osmotically-inducible protein OsmY